MIRKPSIPFLLFGGSLLLLLAIHTFSSIKPYISSIEPNVGVPGQTLTIRGWGFGNERIRITIGGVIPSAAQYEEWSPTRIRVRIPPETPSGLVYVFNKNGKSNPVLFTNVEEIPIPAEEAKDLGFPKIISIEPEKGAVGDLVTIYGRNFGVSRGNGLVYFSWAGNSATLQPKDKMSLYLAASEVDLDYEGWSDTEIRVRIPSGAGSGNLFVLGEKGTSNAVYFEVDGSAGVAVYKEKKTYTVRSSMSIQNVVGREDGGLYLWVPRVQEGPNQRDVQLIEQDPKAEIENYNGLMLVFLKNLLPNRTYRVAQTFLLDRYGIETRLNLPKLKTEYDRTRPLYHVYTAENAVTPVKDPEIKKQVELAIGKEKVPYVKAQRIYQYLTQKVRFEPNRAYRSVVQGLQEGRGDSYTFALLFVAMARNTGIPARTIAGYLVTDTKQALPHFWCEFYLEGVGWIEVDPALGSSPMIDGFKLPLDPKTYYFGNMDNRRIAFSRGLVQAKRVSPYGRTIEQPEIHSLQTIYAEAVGGIRSFSGTWNNLEVIGVY
ncbi:MAG: IPT/TIG domain-containing protein [Spirochaetes bacterium]|nr:IPT/TIG domain-containing protein [Spirochaetota bacterium]